MRSENNPCQSRNSTDKKITIKRIHYQLTWGLRHETMWPDQSIDFIKLPNDNEGTHYGLFIEEKLVTVISLFVDGKEAQFRKFATLTSEQGKGYGTRLLQHLISELDPIRTNKLWCNARADKTSFYAKFGMKETSSRFSKKGIDYVVMEKYL